MEDLFTVSALISLLTLTVLEVVLGIDNVIFVSIILGRIPAENRLRARRIWMIGGILLRSVLLLGLGGLVKNAENELLTVAGYGFNLRNVIMFFGGLFLLYKAVKEIHEMLEGGDDHVDASTAKKAFAAMLNIVTQGDLKISFRIA